MLTGTPGYEEVRSVEGPLNRYMWPRLRIKRSFAFVKKKNYVPKKHMNIKVIHEK